MILFEERIKALLSFYSMIVASVPHSLLSVNFYFKWFSWGWKNFNCGNNSGNEEIDFL
jgi:hypothetical protein